MCSAEWYVIRSKRNTLLRQTDWMAASDLTLSNEWKAQRKALRDLPADQSSKTQSADITWPTPPDEDMLQ